MWSRDSLILKNEEEVARILRLRKADNKRLATLEEQVKKLEGEIKTLKEALRHKS